MLHSDISISLLLPKHKFHFEISTENPFHSDDCGERGLHESHWQDYLIYYSPSIREAHLVGARPTGDKNFKAQPLQTLIWIMQNKKVIKEIS